MKSLLLLFGVLIYMETTAASSFITPDTCPIIKSRSRWGAKPGKKTEYSDAPIKYVIIHHTVTPTCVDEDDCSRRLINIQNYHMNERNFNDIGYNFMIGGDGEVYEGVGWHKIGAHTMGWNSKSIGIGFVGNFSVNPPNLNQLEAGQKLIKCGVALNEIEESYKLFGARSIRATDSPGDALFRLIQDWKGFARSV